MEQPPSNLARDQEEKLSIGWKGITNLSEHSWNSVNHHPKSMSNLYTKPAENLNRNRTYGNVIQHESSLFSSSFSEVFNRKCKCFYHMHQASMHIYGYLDSCIKILLHSMFALFLSWFSDIRCLYSFLHVESFDWWLLISYHIMLKFLKESMKLLINHFLVCLFY